MTRVRRGAGHPKFPNMPSEAGKGETEVQGSDALPEKIRRNAKMLSGFRESHSGKISHIHFEGDLVLAIKLL